MNPFVKLALTICLILIAPPKPAPVIIVSRGNNTLH
jgi:hypothetical protein